MGTERTHCICQSLFKDVGPNFKKCRNVFCLVHVYFSCCRNNALKCFPPGYSIKTTIDVPGNSHLFVNEWFAGVRYIGTRDEM